MFPRLGCWDVSGKPNECDRSECLADKKPPKALNNTKFCCCSESKCNTNFTDAYVPVEDDEETTLSPTQYGLTSQDSFILKIWFSVSIFAAFVLIVSFVFYYCWQCKPNKKNDVETGNSLHHHQIQTPAEYSLDKLKLLNVIGRGRYGSVWRGIVDDQYVAVKVFPAHHRNYFLNEHEIYKVSGENAALLKCYGGGEYQMNPGSSTDYLLLLSLEQECLQEYLKNHTLDINTLSKMSLGIAKGLAHLHSDLGKPCIAHRDINTRNILVRADLSCCICDLGLAVVPRRTENRSLSEAGKFCLCFYGNKHTLLW